MLYHYTSDNNFNSIIKTRKIWAINSTQSNDGLDTIYISELIKENLKLSTKRLIDNGIKIADSSDRFHFDSAPNVIDKILNDKLDQLKNNNSHTCSVNKCFVICFTKKSDSRLLWETYSSNAGINFKLNQNKVINYLNERESDLKSTYKYFKFDKVIYDKDEQKRKIDSIIDDCFKQKYKSTEELSDIVINFQPTFDFQMEDSNKELKLNPITFTIKKWYQNFIHKCINELFIMFT